MMITIITPQTMIPSVMCAWSSDMGNGSGKILEAARTDPPGKNIPVTNLTVITSRGN